jgi:hypothetical protein
MMNVLGNNLGACNRSRGRGTTMQRHIGSWSLAFLVVVASSVAADDAVPTWKKTRIDAKFRSEGVTVADVDKDGRLDILAGDVWYQAPNWTMHALRKVGDYGDGSGGYSTSFACWAEDINGDGWIDVLVIGFPGKPCHWYENPKGKTDVPWKEHLIRHSACNETPLYVDLFGNGRRVLVMATQPEGKDAEGKEREHEGWIAWFAPGEDPTRPWTMHRISEASIPDRITSTTQDIGGEKVTITVKIHGKEVPGTHKFAHGLGVGDVNGDGRKDVICTGGWWEQPEKDDGRPWKFHPANLGPACADMYALDIDGDGKADILSSSAHDYGIWWHQQKPGPDSSPSFLRHALFKDLFSQSHALHLVDLDGDGTLDLVTGKRWWAHGPKGDKAPNDPAVLYWFQGKRDRNGVLQFTPHEIDRDSGIGTQFWIGDINGDHLLDIVVANKKGVFLHEQVRLAR